MKSLTIIAFGLVVLAALAAANPIEAEDDKATADVDLAVGEEDGKLKYFFPD